MGALSSVYDIVRADAAAQAARADATEARNALIDALEARLAAAEDARRADEARKAAFDEEPLTLPPDLDRIQDLPPAKIEDDHTPGPSGELHEIAAKEEPSELPEPPLEVEDAGGVPLSYRNVPLSYVRGNDQAGDLPEELEQPTDPVPEPSGSVYPQPTAIQLNTK
jgi:hypothetical protein